MVIFATVVIWGRRYSYCFRRRQFDSYSNSNHVGPPRAGGRAATVGGMRPASHAVSTRSGRFRACSSSSQHKHQNHP
eukprot:125767-Chlamydomonas_euryale.AAC.2